MANKPIINSDNVCTLFALLLESTQISSIACGITYPAKKYRVSPKNRHSYMFEYVTSGGGYVECNGQTIPVSAGDTLCFRRNSTYNQYSDPENPYNKIWIDTRGEIIDALLLHYNFSNDVYVLKADTYDVFSELHRAILNNADLEAITLLMHKLIFRMYQCKMTQCTKQVDVAKSIKDYIDAHIAENMHLEDVATIFYISKIQLIRLFKKAYNTTPYAYILDAKIRMARNLLATTNDSIKDISLQLSFTDEHYFTNSFRRCTGMPPGEFRKRYIEMQLNNKHNG